MPKVLIVDDNEDNRDLLAYLLTRRGHTALTAAGGEEGVDLAAAEQPDLILMDLAMPEVDGHAAARLIRAQGALAATPIVAMSAAYGTPLTYNGPEEGLFDGFFRLPIEPRTLLAEIETYLPGTWASRW